MLLDGSVSERQVSCVRYRIPKSKRPLGSESAIFVESDQVSLFVNFAADEMTLSIELVVGLGTS
jgi:hypothetical protein